jgi:hypothetical protein
MKWNHGIMEWNEIESWNHGIMESWNGIMELNEMSRNIFVKY